MTGDREGGGQAREEGTDTARTAERITCSEACKNALLLDLEVTRAGVIREIGAVLLEDEFRWSGPGHLGQALADLDEFARAAEIVVGHNILGHDLPILRAASGSLRLLSLPAVDTLYLSPLAFPENPYHRLVKNYRLVSASRNDPVADARLAWTLFRDQWAAFSGVSRSDPGLLALYRYCFAESVLGRGGHGRGIAGVFRAIGADGLSSAKRAAKIFSAQAKGKACASAVRRIAEFYTHRRDRCPELAFVTAWLRVAGAKSVLPPWVRLEFPGIVESIRALRDSPCKESSCAYCRQAQDPELQLRSYFDFPEFRATEGKPLQRDIVLAGMNGESLLALLPTGGGKSLCFQLPAFVRHQRRGVLTVVISPLQALMKDQVEGLERRTGTTRAAALNGLLTPPERGEVLERVRLGDIAILYVSPEQLRNRSFKRAISYREIGVWVFDEAHCISKWGHDFRPDYFHASRFVRELAGEQRLPIPPVACFTATGKPDVIDEIRAHFDKELGQHLRVFKGPVDRDNLRFEVQEVTRPGKLERVYDVLKEKLFSNGSKGSGIVYCATRRRAEDVANHLQRRGMPVEAFHARIPAPEKRRIQEEFLADRLRLIAATNAFGMGIDKADVRVVVHADIPGSLESYLQEAGRAGRDLEDSDCVLLFSEQDIETQFRLGALSRITQYDIAAILRGLRRAAKRQGAEVVLTPGEILRDEKVDTTFDSGDRSADTKVKMALSWLERAGFLLRNENRTEVFQGAPKFKDLEEATDRIRKLDLPAPRQVRWLEVLRELLNANPDDGISLDDLASLPGYAGVVAAAGAPSGRAATMAVARDLHDMANVGLIEEGLLLTAFVRQRGRGASKGVYERSCSAEVALLQLIREEAPDADPGDWQHVDLRALNQRLKDRGIDSSPEMIRLLLKSLSQDGRGLAGSRGSLELAQVSRFSYRAKVLRSWKALVKTAEIRRMVAGEALGLLLEKARAARDGSGELLVSFSVSEVARRIRANLVLNTEVRKPLEAIDRGLMFLHEQRAIILQQGLAVFRQAMTVCLNPDAKGRGYLRGDYESLARHYEERVFQVHVMNEYARLGLEGRGRAGAFVHDCFSLDQKAFFRRHFAGREEIVARATGQESFRRIVEDLGNPSQIAVVAAPSGENMLVLAGPGSGKTRVVVHRCAYLLRVVRARPESILILCFNHNAAVELRKRLAALVGLDAREVTVLTYHALAMRLSGISFAESAERSGGEAPDFDALVKDAARLLRGETEVAGLEPDEVRVRLLSGYRHILVDEYQDIDEDQYALISAIAGRTEKGAEEKLAILAVGDDDQNIYTWRGANVRFLKRFEEDYRARRYRLLESYRSTKHILDTTNRFIAANHDRMKVGDPIRVDEGRVGYAEGGRWQGLDPVGQGRVQVIATGGASAEAAAVAGEILRMKELDAGSSWQGFAVLSRTRRALDPIRAMLEHEGVPLSLVFEREKTPPLHRIRELANFLDGLRKNAAEPTRASGLQRHAEKWKGDGALNPWAGLLFELLRAWRDESSDAELPMGQALEFLYESLAQRRRESRIGDGVFLGTVHAAKGMEFPHVFLPAGGWDSHGADGEAEEERRVQYVGMTRAQETLALFDRPDVKHPHLALVGGPAVLRREAGDCPLPPPGVLSRRYEILGLRDLFIDYAGFRDPRDPIHGTIAALEPGSALRMTSGNGNLGLVDSRGGTVARLSAAAAESWAGRLDAIESIRVVAVVRRFGDDTGPDYRPKMKCESWEVPIVEVVSGP